MIKKTLGMAVLVALSLILSTIEAKAYTDEQAIKAVLGEARGEYVNGDNYPSMYAVACAIRNRGTLKGVYGATASMEEIGPELYQQASRAWFNSEDGGDPTLGATHWHNVEREGENYWTKKLTRTYKVGSHTFFRESRR